MAGKIEKVVIVELEENTKYHQKGSHAMSKKLADKLKSQKVKMKIIPAKEKKAEIVAKIKEKLEAQEEAQIKANAKK